MKIARIESFILGTKSSKDLLFCRVETDDGFYGWGEGYVTAGKETFIAECVKAMAPYVIGRGVFNIRHTGQVMFEDFAIRRGSLARRVCTARVRRSSSGASGCVTPKGSCANATATCTWATSR